MIAPYASDPAVSRGRLFPEGESPHRTPFQRDRDRIIHSTAFRRLKQKTQVFVADEGDLFRTRLTHTIEVGQVARTIAKHLGLNVELSEAIALAHDLGHPPFGHVGEDILAERMEPYGGFDHNAQAIKLVTSLERNYAEFDGLNLTWESLSGIAKHNGPVMGEVPYALAEYNQRHDLSLEKFASGEAQVAALADDIAYNNHDLDDGLRAGLFNDDALLALPLVGDCYAEVDQRYPKLDPRRRRGEALRRVFGHMVEDVIRQSEAALSGMAQLSDIEDASGPVIAFSPAMLSDINAIRKFLFDNMYRAAPVIETRKSCKKIMRFLFDHFMDHPEALPVDWAIEKPDSTALARHICDYISGMTDVYASELYHKLSA